MKCRYCGFEESIPWRCSKCSRVHWGGFVTWAIVATALIALGVFSTCSASVRWFCVLQGLMLFPYKTFVMSPDMRGRIDKIGSLIFGVGLVALGIFLCPSGILRWLFIGYGGMALLGYIMMLSKSDGGKYVAGIFAGVVVLATLGLFCWEIYNLGFMDTLRAIGLFIHDALQTRIILVALILLAGIPVLVLTVYNGDIGAAFMRRMALLVSVMVALSTILAFVGIWVIPFSRYGSVYASAYRFLENGDYGRARTRFERLLRKSRSPAQAAECEFMIAACYYEQGDYTTALESCLRCEKKYGGTAVEINRGVPALIGDCYVRLGDEGRAREWYLRCPRLVPDPEKRIQSVISDPRAPL